MRTILTILFFTLGRILKAQSPADTLILTKEQNDKWVLKLEKDSKSRQLELIRKRILMDTNVYVNQYYADGIKVDNDKLRGKRTEAYGRLPLVFNQRYVADINNWTENKSVLKLADLLTDMNIKNVSILKGNQAAAIYGSKGASGVILLTTKDKRTFELIKKINLD